MKTICIIEDNESIIQVLTILLKSHGYSVESTMDPINALKFIKKVNADLVLMDLMMPQLDGETILKDLRKEEKLAKLPVIILTGKVDPLAGAPALKLADDLISKPYKNEDLVKRVAACLRKKRAK